MVKIAPESYNYFPLVRTRAAELKGFSNLSASVMNGITPIFELTKSRRSKNNPIADISIRINEVIDIMDDKPFLLDLTTERQWGNEQIDYILQNYENGFNAWLTFLDNLAVTNVIPIIQYHIDAAKLDFTSQITELENKYGTIAYRANLYNIELINILKVITETVQDPTNFILILDAGFVEIGSNSTVINIFIHKINEILSELREVKFHLVPILSSFPSAVAKGGYGGQNVGSFNLYEVSINGNITPSFPQLAIHYGDYSLIHPKAYGGGGNWIPRVDVPMNTTCFYHRYRREEGGYIRAAENVVGDGQYQLIRQEMNWGDQQIALASRGNPEGISPSHWIAVRLNMHITRQFYRLQDDLT